MTFDKKTARNVFFAGSVILFGALILLTISFHKEVPERTQEAVNLTPLAIHGKEVWEAHNCINCHARFGEGAYYAPDLTRVLTRRGEHWFRHFMREPVVAYYGTFENAEGRRKMPHLDLSDEDIEGLLAFFNFLEGVDTNDWPPEASVRSRGVPLPDTGPIAEAWQDFRQLGCTLCHPVNGFVPLTDDFPQGPDLTFAASRLTREWMVEEIMDPTADYPASPMPNYGPDMTRERAERLVDLLEYVNVRNGGRNNE